MAFNVLDYGARGDGISDDTAEIQAAINAAHAAGGGIVYIPAGTYIVSGTSDKSDGAIRLLDNVTLYGAGMGATILKVRDDNPYAITGVVRTPFDEVTHDVAMFDLTIDGNRANNVNKIDGFYCGVAPGDTRQDYNITIERVEIMNCTGYGFDPHEQTLNLRIADSVAHHNVLDGFVADFLVDSVYENNIAYANDRHGFNVTTSTDGLVLLNNTAYDNGSAGLIVQRGSEDIPFPQDITVQGGSYYDNAREGIFLKMADNVSITGVQVYDNMRHGIRIEGATDTLVQNSTIFNNSQAADNTYDEIQIRLHSDSTTGQPYYSLGTQILNNTIYSNGAVNARYGVREDPSNDDGGATGTVVSGNTISGMDSGATSLPPAPADDPVVAADDAYVVAAGTTFTATTAQSLLKNDQIPDGGGAALTGQYATTQGGTVSINNDGTFTYTARAGFVGTDRFDYTVRDADGDTDIGTATLDVRAAASIGVGTTQLETLTLAGFTAVSVKAAIGGTAVESRTTGVEARAKGTFTGEAGTYGVTLRYFDENDGASPMGIRVNGVTAASWIADKQLGSSGSDSSTVTTKTVTLSLRQNDVIEIYGTRNGGELVRVDQLTVELTGAPPPDRPVTATDDSYSATEDSSLSVSAANGVLANDITPDGGKTATAATIETAAGGTVNLAADGSFTYNPLEDFFGSDSFDYSVFDADGDRDTGTVFLSVADVPESGPPPAYPEISTGKTQLETLALDSFVPLALRTADGGQAIESRNKGIEATATGSFTGVTGTYQATLWYYDENDGSSALGIRVNGEDVASWLADKQLGSSVADAMSRTSYSTNLDLARGDTIEIYGVRDANELVRIDYLSLDGIMI